MIRLLLFPLSLLVGPCWVFGHEMIRERRRVDDLDGVLGFRCLKCGVWQQAIWRSPLERRRMGL